MKTLVLKSIVVSSVVSVLLFARLSASVLYVAPGGSDRNAGTRSHPFATLMHARDAARKIKQNGSPKNGVTIRLRGGVYSLNAPLQLTPADSGSAGAPEVWESAPGETAVITGAHPICGWAKLAQDPPGTTPEAHGKLFAAVVPKGWRFHFLFVNGHSQQVARMPKGADPGSWPPPLGTGRITPQGLRIELPPALLKNLNSDGDAEASFLPCTFWNTLAVVRNVTRNQVTLASRNPSTWMNGGKCWAQNGNLQLQNSLSLLSEPGEWCVDSTRGRVYYWPPDGTMVGKTVLAPLPYELLRLQGDDLAATGSRWRIKYGAPRTPDRLFRALVRHVEIRNLTFACTDRLPEDRWPAEWLKRNCENPDAALYLEGVQECVIQGCTVRGSGSYAIALNHYAQSIRVTRNDLVGSASGGVQITGYGPGTVDVNSRNVIQRNFIHEIGQDYLHSPGVQVYGSNSDQISLNWFADIPYAAVLISGMDLSAYRQPHSLTDGPAMDLSGDQSAMFQVRWGDLPQEIKSNEALKPFLHCSSNRISRNIVDHCMTKLVDGGALYSFANGHGTIWLDNVVAHTDKNAQQAWVAYLDENSGRSLVQGTLAWDVGPEIWFDHSLITVPPGVDVVRHTVNTVPAVYAKAPTVSWWRDNRAGDTEKPAGFDARVREIAAQAQTAGGWPSRLTPARINDYLQKDNSHQKSGDAH